MYIVSFASSKGGVGKSTLCILCARYLASIQKKVLCIDCDIQNSLTFSLLDKTHDVKNHNIVKVLEENNLDEHILYIHKFLSIIPSNIQLRDIKNLTYSSMMNLLENNKNFDYCLIDTSPYLNNVSLSVFRASDLIICPLFLGQLEWKSSLMFKKDIAFYLGESDKIRFLINRCSFTERNEENKITQQYLELLEKSFKNHILKIKIPEIRNINRILDTNTQIKNIKKFEKLFECIKSLVIEVFQINEVPDVF